MNILIVHKKYRDNQLGVYSFVKDVVERYGMEEGIAVHPQYSEELKINHTTENIIFLRIPDKEGLALTWWYRYTLPGLVKKLSITKIIYINALALTGLPVPQVYIFTDTTFTQPIKKAPAYQEFLRKKFTRSLQHARELITYSRHAAGLLQPLAGNETARINVVYPAASYRFMERSFNEKEIRKEILTGGHEFFLAKVNDLDDEDLIKLLKAFTGFKKWQKSQMKLVITGFEKGMHVALKRKLMSYKHVEDVLLLEEEHTDIYPEILSAAYAFILLAKKDCEVMPVLEAMQSYTLLIATDMPSIREVAGNAFIALPSNDQDAISKSMIDAYKDESLAERYVMEGAARVQDFNYDTAKLSYFERLKH